MDEWADLRCISIIDNDPFLNNINVTYKAQEPILLYNNNGLSLELVCSRVGPTLNVVQKDVHIAIETYIKIKKQEGMTLEDLHKNMFLIRNLISLATTKPVYPLKVFACADNIETALKVYFKIGEIPEEKFLLPMEMLFSLEDIKDNVKMYFSNWVDKSEILRPVYSLFFSDMYNSHSYLESSFLNQVYALESYHRRTRKNAEISEAEHKIRVDEILNSVPDKYKSWLEKKLKYSNEPTLKNRLKELLNYMPEMQELVKDVKGFTHKLVVTRNYLTHYDESLKEQAIKGKDLFIYISILRAFTVVYLLLELGFDKQFIINSLGKIKRMCFMQ